MTCVLLLNFRTFMETPFALNSRPLRQRARWRVRSQVSWRKTCKASALYTIGIHAFFINLRNPIPLQIHESSPFATPDAKSCFCFPCLWQSISALFQQYKYCDCRQSKHILLKMRKKKSVAVTVVRPLLWRNLLISLCMKIKILFELLR